MALKDFVASRLSAPAGRVLDAPIRDIVHEILKEAGYASPAEIQSLRDEIRDLSRQLDALRQQSGELARQLQEARAGDDPRVAQLGARLDALSASIDARLAALEAAPQPESRSGSRADQTLSRIDALDARIAAFPGVVEQRLAPIEARLALLPAEIETRIEESQLRLQAEKEAEQEAAEAAPQAVEPSPAAVEPEDRAIQVVRAVGDTLTLSIGSLLDAIDTAASAIGAGTDNATEPATAPATEPATAPAPEPARPPAEAKPDCRHPGCGQPVRARGFCGSHYQQWRRGGLRGYVTIDGSAVVNGPEGEEIRSVGTGYSGLPCEMRDGQLYVDGVKI